MNDWLKEDLFMSRAIIRQEMHLPPSGQTKQNAVSGDIKGSFLERSFPESVVGASVF